MTSREEWKKQEACLQERDTYAFDQLGGAIAHKLNQAQLGQPFHQDEKRGKEQKCAPLDAAQQALQIIGASE